MNEKIIIRGLNQNNLKNVDLDIPKGKIVVFTGVSGSGKSSIVFDTIAAESARQLNETFPAFIRGRLPKHQKPQVDLISNLNASIIVDQTQLGGNARSTVGTISDLYNMLRLLFSRIGEPYAGAASFFSFNDPNGMCKTCSGLGKVTDIDVEVLIDKTRSLSEGAIMDSTFKVGSWYLKKYLASGLFDNKKPLNQYSEEEYHTLIYGKEGIVEGIYNTYRKYYLTRDTSSARTRQKEKIQRLLTEKQCPDCHGHRLNRKALSCWINGYNIAQLCEMELTQLRKVLLKIDDKRVTNLLKTLVDSITRLIDIGLEYLSLNRESSSLSGGEAQRLKLVRYMGSSLTGMLYIFDEPSTGMHPRDVFRLNRLLMDLRDRGNTVLVVEHDKDVISIADEVIDIGPNAGIKGGEIVFQGPYEKLLKSNTLTGQALRNNVLIKRSPRIPKSFLPIRNACLNNLKNIDVDIPTGVLSVITGVAGSGKSSLISGVFSKQYRDSVIHIDQSPITATNRSNPASYLGFMDEIRKIFASENHVSESLFSYNSDGACPQCHGKGVIVTELVFMDPIVTVCEKCEGKRYSQEALMYKYKGKNIIQVLSMTAEEALLFFDDKKITRSLNAMCRVGLSYMTLGQSLSSLSGGERQRIKLADHLDKKGNIYVLDEPTTGLHPSDCDKLMALFDSFVDDGNTVIIIEHNLNVMKRADYIIDIGPDGGTHGGQVVFTGTPQQMVRTSDSITAICLKASVDQRELTAEEREKINYKYDTLEEEEMGNMQLRPIGRIECEDGDFSIALDRRYAQALKGLENFSHVQVIWWFDGCEEEKFRNILTNEKPYTNGPDVLGTFATRSPCRPNPIAVTTAQITYIDQEKCILGLAFIDALDGTPVLDLKPYTPSLDRVQSPQVPQWCSHWPNSLEGSGDFDWEKEFNFKA